MGVSGSVSAGFGRASMFFFFQAEDGIRDGTVTGVQTCALPICTPSVGQLLHEEDVLALVGEDLEDRLRSEERREGKSVDLGGRRIIKKKKKSTKDTAKMTYMQHIQT